MKRVTHRELLGCSWRSLIKTVNDRSSVTSKLFFWSFFPGEGRLKVNRWSRPLRHFAGSQLTAHHFGCTRKRGQKLCRREMGVLFLGALCRRINHPERVGVRWFTHLLTIRPHLHSFAVIVQLGSITQEGFLVKDFDLLLASWSQKLPFATPTHAHRRDLCCSSVLHSLLLSITSPEEQTDFWMSHPICQPAPSPPLCSRGSFITSPQPKRAKGGSGVSRHKLFLVYFFFFFFKALALPPLSSSFRLPHLRQSDIYRGMLRLFGSPCSFWWKNTEGSGEEARGLVKELCWKRVKSLKAGFEIFATSAARMYERERRGFFSLFLPLLFVHLKYFD